MRRLPGTLMPVPRKIVRALAIYCRTCASSRDPVKGKAFSQLPPRDLTSLLRLANWRQNGELVRNHGGCMARAGEARRIAGVHSRAKDESGSASASATTDEAGAGVGAEAESGSGAGQGPDVFRAFIHQVGTGLTGAKSSAAAALKKAREAKLLDAARDGYSFLKEELTSTGPKKKVPTWGPVAPDTTVKAMTYEKKQSAWEKRWDDWKGRAEAHPWYKKLSRVKEHPVYAKGEEIADDIRDRWETSDSPVVHKIQDLNESVFGETATAMAIKEIRRRDPAFSYPDFVAEVQQCVRPVLQAYLKGDAEALKTWCSEGVTVRCRAEMGALNSMGIYPDNKILHVSDVQVRETKLLGSEPVIVVSFQAQQINCARDREGNIVEGARDDIHTVYYLWAMQHISPEEMISDNATRWQLREMQKLGMPALI